MKKILAIVLAFALLLAFASCAKKDSAGTTAKEESNISIVCTIFPQYDFVRAITKGVEGVSLKMLLAPGDESHSYSATLEDISAIDSADIFIYVGGENDEWVEDVLKTASPKKTVALTKLVKTLEESDKGILAKEEEEEEEEGAADEHVWTSLKNSAQIITSLAETISEADSANAETYRANASAYVKQFEALDAKFTAFFEGVKNKTIVIADRNPFRYFCEDYGIKAIAACKRYFDLAVLVHQIKGSNSGKPVFLGDLMVRFGRTAIAAIGSHTFCDCAVKLLYQLLDQLGAKIIAVV